MVLVVAGMEHKGDFVRLVVIKVMVVDTISNGALLEYKNLMTHDL